MLAIIIQTKFEGFNLWIP